MSGRDWLDNQDNASDQRLIVDGLLLRGRLVPGLVLVDLDRKQSALHKGRLVHLDDVVLQCDPGADVVEFALFPTVDREEFADASL